MAWRGRELRLHARRTLQAAAVRAWPASQPRNQHSERRWACGSRLGGRPCRGLAVSPNLGVQLPKAHPVSGVRAEVEQVRGVWACRCPVPVAGLSRPFSSGSSGVCSPSSRPASFLPPLFLLFYSKKIFSLPHPILQTAGNSGKEIGQRRRDFRAGGPVEVFVPLPPGAPDRFNSVSGDAEDGCACLRSSHRRLFQFTSVYQAPLFRGHHGQGAGPLPEGSPALPPPQNDLQWGILE